MARVDWRIISNGYDRTLFACLNPALKRQIITHQIRSIKPFTQAWKRNSRGFSLKRKKSTLVTRSLLNPSANSAIGSDLWCRNNYTRTFMGSHRRSFKQTLRPLGSILDLLWTACKHQLGGVLYMLVLSLGIFNACHTVSLESDGLAGLFYEMKQLSPRIW